MVSRSVRTAMDRSEIVATAENQRNIMVGAGLVAILLLVGITLLALDKIAVKPLRELEAYARRVSEGDLDCTLDLVRRNEIGALADSLRSMVLCATPTTRSPLLL